MSATMDLREFAEEYGWDDAEQIAILCEFIDQMGRRQPNFRAFLIEKVDSYEEEYSEEEDIS